MDLKSKPIFILSRGPDLTLNATNLLSTKLKQQGYNVVSKPMPNCIVIVSDLVPDKPLKEWLDKCNLQQQQQNINLVSVRWARQVIITKKNDPVLDPCESRWTRKSGFGEHQPTFINQNVVDMQTSKATNKDLTDVLPEGFPDAFRQSALALTELCERHRRDEAFVMQRIPLKYREKATAIGTLPHLQQATESRHNKRQVLAPI